LLHTIPCRCRALESVSTTFAWKEQEVGRRRHSRSRPTAVARGQLAEDLCKKAQSFLPTGPVPGADCWGMLSGSEP
jgi:hypothetical protein